MTPVSIWQAKNTMHMCLLSLQIKEDDSHLATRVRIKKSLQEADLKC